MTEFIAIRPKAYSYLIDDSNSHKKLREKKKSVIKKALMFHDYKNCFFKRSNHHIKITTNI